MQADATTCAREILLKSPLRYLHCTAYSRQHEYIPNPPDKQGKEHTKDTFSRSCYIAVLTQMLVHTHSTAMIIHLPPTTSDPL